MPRKPRIEFEGAFYHVTTRGNQRQNIYKDEEDFRKYLEILTRYKKRYGFNLYAYVLMSNHVHLLVETGSISLSKIFQGINQSFTLYFNKKYNLSGHLFQGRYRAILCEKDAYLLSLLKYIHLNPVRAGMVKDVKDYRWSSHKVYTGETKQTELIDADDVLGIFSIKRSNARELYQCFISDAETIEKQDVYRTVDQQLLGNEAFIDEVIKKSSRVIEKKRMTKEYTLNEIAIAVERMFCVDIEQLRGKGKSENSRKGKKLFSIVSNEYGYKGSEIATFIGKDPSVITRHLKEKKELEKEVEEVINSLSKAQESQ
ncbi:MAG: transposase [Deltaproteobacteria bacterium]|nr:transposase [Deltaproteobacteria bacterium]